MIYLLNSPVLTEYGRWVFTGPVAIMQIRELMQQGFVSGVGHDSTAQFLTGLLGMDIASKRCSVTMEAGDQAVVFRLLERQDEGKILSCQELANCDYEFGLLTLL